MDESKKYDIDLSFDVDIDNSKPMSYKDIIFNRNEVMMVRNKVKELEKEFNIKKEEKLLKDNKDFSNIEIINDKETIIKEVYNYDIPLLKTLVDNAFNKISNGIIFIANIKEGNVNYISRSNCNLSSGELVKEASIKSKGNGGGSNSFAQGGGTDITCIDEIIESIKSRL